MKVVWDNPGAVIAGDLQYITVRPLSAITSLDNPLPPYKYTVIFGKDKTNRFLETDEPPRALFAPLVPCESGTNAIRLYRDENEPELTATINFTTVSSQSDLNEFAFGYGLYFISIEIPSKTCSGPYFARIVLPIDFRDSRYPYGSEDIEIRFRIADHIWQTPEKPYDPFEANVNAYIKIKAPKTVDLTPQPKPGSYRRFCCLPQQSVASLWDMGAPEYNFTVVNKLFEGKTNDDINTLYLTHSATFIESKNILDTDPNTNTFKRFKFIVQSEFFVKTQENELIYGSQNDITVKMEGFPEFSTDPNAWVTRNDCAFSAVGTESHRIHFKNAGVWQFQQIEGPEGKWNLYQNYGTPSGFRFTNYVMADFSYCDFTLALPIHFVGKNKGGPGTIQWLQIDNCKITTTASSQEVINGFVPKNCAIFTKDVPVFITNNFITGAWLVAYNQTYPQTGIISTGYCQGTKILNNIIKGLNGYGVELINLAGYNDYPAQQYYLKENTIEANRFHGVFLRGGDTNPYLFDNYFYQNGPGMPGGASKYDGVNIFEASAVIQNNKFVKSGMFGVRTAINAGLYGWHINISGQTDGLNCFIENFHNLGELNSRPHRIDLGSGPPSSTNPSDFKGKYNSFIDPIDPDGHFQAVIDNSAALLDYNYWLNRNYPNDDPAKIDRRNGAQVAKSLFWNPTDNPCIGLAPPTTPPLFTCNNCQAVADILEAEGQGNKSRVKEIAIPLLRGNPEPHEADFAAMALVRVLQETKTDTFCDEEILVFLDSLARYGENETAAIAAGFTGMHAFDIAGEYQNSISLGSLFTQRYSPESVHWKNAHIHNAFVWEDRESIRANAIEILDSLLEYYPDDPQVISSYYSITATLPPALLEKGSRNVANSRPAGVELHQCYPNPFNPTTAIMFTLAKDDVVSLVILDAVGREIATPVKGYREAGAHTVNFDAGSLPSGTYFYRLTTSQTSITRSMMLLK